MNSTDQEWERWGRQDPYFGVITWDRFRADRLDDAARAEFFASGQAHVDAVLNSCRKYIDPQFTPTRVLDFGCGVGRLVVPFAAVATEVVGVDISPSMLAEARRNCDERQIGNVRLELSDDQLTRVHGDFDLVHSAIVLQHIEVARGRQIFRRLVELVRPGGIGALQLTYGKSQFPDSFGQPPAPPRPAPAPARAPTISLPGWLKRLFGRRPTASVQAPEATSPSSEASDAGGDPQMLMNPYSLSEIAFVMQSAGIARFDAEFTDHGGELGVFLFFRRPGNPAPAHSALAAESLIATGNLLQAQGRWVEAVQHWEKALEAVPDNATMLLSLAVAHLRCHDLERAETTFALLRSTCPGNPWGRMGIGLLAEARKQWDEALETYLAINREHPRHVSCVEAIVRVYQQANRAEDARDFLLRTLSHDPPLAEAEHMLATLSKRQ